MIVDVCAKHKNCNTDEGAMQKMNLVPEDLTSDLEHLSVPGQAKMAWIAFATLFPDA